MECNSSCIKFSLSVLVTVYSETQSIRDTILKLIENDREYLKEIILLISPMASVETFSICKEMVATYSLVRIHVQKNNPGIGWAYREGIKIASSDYICLMAADLETDPIAVDEMMKKIEETDCELVVPNRWMKGGGFEGYDPLKLVLNWIFQKMFQVIFWTGVGDLTFGFKIMKSSIAKETKWVGTMHEICVETTVRPIKSGCRVEQVPTKWKGRREGKSINKLLKNFRYFWLALKIRFNLA